MFLICCRLPFHQRNKFNQRRALSLGTRLPNLNAPDPRKINFFLTQEGDGEDDREKNKTKIKYNIFFIKRIF